MRTVRRFPDLASAQVAQSVLRAQGIDALIAEEHLAGIHWGLNTAIQGIRLQVSPDQFAEAEDLLDSWSSLPDDVDVGEPLEEEEKDRTAAICPSCGSDQPEATEWRRRLKGLVLIFPFLILFWPLTLRMARWRCGHCESQW